MNSSNKRALTNQTNVLNGSWSHTHTRTRAHYHPLQIVNEVLQVNVISVAYDIGQEEVVDPLFDLTLKNHRQHSCHQLQKEDEADHSWKLKGSKQATQRRRRWYLGNIGTVLSRWMFWHLQILADRCFLSELPRSQQSPGWRWLRPPPGPARLGQSHAAWSPGWGQTRRPAERTKTITVFMSPTIDEGKNASYFFLFALLN